MYRSKWYIHRLPNETEFSNPGPRIIAHNLRVPRDFANSFLYLKVEIVVGGYSTLCGMLGAVGSLLSVQNGELEGFRHGGGGQSMSPAKGLAIAPGNDLTGAILWLLC